MVAFNTVSSFLILIAGALCLKRLIARKSQKLPLPPGPPRLPIIGNLLVWPWENQWATWAKWGHQYGDVIYTSIGTTGVVVLNSVEAASKTLNEKGSIYSGRPQPYFMNEQIGWKDVLICMDDPPRVRASRRLLLQQLGAKTALGRLEPIIQDKIRRFVQKILYDHSPEGLVGHVRMLFGSIILDTTYGYQVKEKDDELLPLIEKVMADGGHYVQPGSALVDVFPWSVASKVKWLPSWMPGTGYRELGRQLNQELKASRDIPYTFTRRQMATGTHGSSFIASHVEGGRLSSEDEDILKHAAMIMYTAGVDTSASAALSFILLMALYPDIQARARAEIDSVVGLTRLPKLSDRQHLTYLNAIISEVLRFGEVAPTGVPHLLHEDDINNGFFIPRGTVVISNIWAMCRDSRVYAHPERFNPDRFMGNEPELDPRTYVFGFGRRICPGRFFAENGLFIQYSTMLATLNITKACNLSHNETTPPLEYEGAGPRCPKLFPCKIQIRSAQAEGLLSAELT